MDDLAQMHVDKIWGLGNLMMTAAQRPLHYTVGIYNQQNVELALKSNWAFGVKPNSNAHVYGPMKVAQLLLTPPETQFAMTPVPTVNLGPKYMGGVLKLVDGSRYVFAVSGLHYDACDALLALPLCFALTYELRLHHYGVRHSSEEDALAAVKRDEQRLNSYALHLPTGEGPDFHHRWYIRVETDQSPNGVYWVEHQYFPHQQFGYPMIHWDLATSADLLTFLGTNLPAEPNSWKDEAGPNDPYGMIKLTNTEPDQSGLDMAIMVRDHFTDPQDW